MIGLYFIKIYYVDRNGYSESVYSVLKKFTEDDLIAYCAEKKIKSIKKL